MSDARILSDAAARILDCVLDEIIPARPDGRLPGAGALGVGREIERAMRAEPDLVPAVTDGLDALAAHAPEGGAFPDLPAAERRRRVHEVAASQPAFLPGLIFHTYIAYYQHDRVLEALGLEARPPHPLGYALEPGDFDLLERVRERGKRYRDA
jgi:hypothetical protein